MKNVKINLQDKYYKCMGNISTFKYYSNICLSKVYYLISCSPGIKDHNEMTKNNINFVECKTSQLFL